MGLKDRIEEDMYVDTESLLEDEFERAQELFDIYEDNTVVLTEMAEEVESKQEVLTHLVAWRYIAEANDDATPGLSYDYFYERIDAGDSTIRGYVSDFVDENLVRENEEDGKELVVEQLDTVLDRIEAAADVNDD